jgi:predicted nucleic acid-binding protein
MARADRVRTEVFLDSAYAIALAAPSDQLHARALTLAEQLEAGRTRLLTTPAVLLEIGNALSKRRHRAAAVQLLSALSSDPTVEIMPLTPGLYGEAFELYRTRTDKEWGLIDCVSFVVMSARGITEALTYDEHFEQAGFQALLRDS